MGDHDGGHQRNRQGLMQITNLFRSRSQSTSQAPPPTSSSLSSSLLSSSASQHTTQPSHPNTSHHLQISIASHGADTLTSSSIHSGFQNTSNHSFLSSSIPSEPFNGMSGQLSPSISSSSIATGSMYSASTHGSSSGVSSRLRSATISTASAYPQIQRQATISSPNLHSNSNIISSHQQASYQLPFSRRDESYGLDDFSGYLDDSKDLSNLQSPGKYAVSIDWVKRPEAVLSAGQRIVASFTIDYETYQTTELPVICLILSEKRRTEFKEKIEMNVNGEFDLNVLLKRAGEYNLWVLLGNQPCSSPIQLQIIPGEVCPRACRADGIGLLDGVVGYPTFFRIQALDAYGNKRTEGGEGFEVRLSDFMPSGHQQTLEKMEVKDYRNGTYSVAYQPSKSGLHHVVITWEGTQIHGSPYLVNYFPASVMSDLHRQGLLKFTALYHVGVSKSLEVQIRLTPHQIVVKQLVKKMYKTKKDLFELMIRPSMVVRKVDTPTMQPRTGFQIVDEKEEYQFSSPQIDDIIASISAIISAHLEHLCPLHCELQSKPSKPILAGVAETWIIQAKNYFGQNLRNGGESMVQVKLVGPESISATIVDQKNGTYIASFQATKCGCYDAYLTINNSHIASSPIRGLVVKPGKASGNESIVIGLEEMNGTAGFETSFELHTKDCFGNACLEGSARVRVEVCHESGSLLSTQVVDQLNGCYLISFTPVTAGAYSVDVFVEDKPLKGQPLHLTVSAAMTSPEHSSTKEGSINAVVGHQSYFTIQTCDAFGNLRSIGGDKIQVLIERDTWSDEATVIDHGDGAYYVYFMAFRSGIHFISAKISNRHIQGSPFQCTVRPCTTSPHHCEIVGEYRRQFVASEQVFLTLQARDSYGNPRDSGGDDVRVCLLGESRLNGSVVDHENGLYSVYYSAARSGRYILYITIGDTMIGSDPLMIEVLPCKTHGGMCLASGPGLTETRAGVEATVMIQARDKHGNLRTEGGDYFRIEFYDGDQVLGHADCRSTILDNKNGTYLVKYRLFRIGHYSIHILCCPEGKDTESAHIFGSPFRDILVQSTSTYPENCEVIAFPTDGIVVGQLSCFTLQAKDVYGNKRQNGGDQFDGRLKHTSRQGEDVQIKIKDNDDGTYLFYFMPTMSGLHELLVSLGTQVINLESKLLHVTQASTSARDCIAFGIGLNGTVAGSTASFTIRANDRFGNARGIGGDQFDVSLSGPASVPGTVIDNHDGTYGVSFVCSKSGCYSLSVTLRGVHINGSVFRVPISPGSPHSSNCLVFGPGIGRVSAGQLVIFYIEAFDRFKNRVQEKADFAIYLVRCKETEKQITNQGVLIDKGLYDIEETKTLIDNIHYTGDGKYLVCYTAYQAGPYTLYVNQDEEPVKGSPFLVEVEPAQTFASKCTIIRSSRERLSVGEQDSLVIQAKDQYGNKRTNGGDQFKVKLILQSSPDIVVDAVMVDSGDGTYYAYFTPTRSGRYSFDVSLDGEPVIHLSAQSIDVWSKMTSPRDCLALGDGLHGAIAGREATFTVQARDLYGNYCCEGGDHLDVKLTGPGSVFVNVIDHNDGSYTVRYRAPRSGNYLLSVVLGDEHLAFSPASLTVIPGDTDPDRCEISGDGISGGRAGETNVFTISTHDSCGNPRGVGGDKFQVLFESQSGSLVSAGESDTVVFDNSDGTYTVTYRLKKSGTYAIKIYCGGTKITNKSFGFLEIKSSNACAPLCSLVDIYPKKIVAGKLAYFIVEARDAYGNSLQYGGDPFEVKVTGPDEVQTLMVDLQNGTYKCHFCLTIAKHYTVRVTLGGIDVFGSPFRLDVDAGDVYGFSCTAEGTGLTSAIAGCRSSFTVKTFDRFLNPCEAGGKGESLQVALVGSSGTIDALVTDNNDGSYLVDYLSKKSGTYSMFVKYGGDHIKGSPFRIVVEIAPTCASECHIVGEFLQEYFAGIESTFTIQARDENRNERNEGGDTFQVFMIEKCEADSKAMTKIQKILDNQDGTYEVMFVCTKMGSYELHAMHDGSHIKGSPFHFKVKSSALSPSHCVAYGPGLLDCYSHHETFFNIQARDVYNNTCQAGGDSFTISMTEVQNTSIGKTQILTCVDFQNGLYYVKYTPQKASSYEISIKVHGSHIMNSPFRVQTFEGQESKTSLYCEFFKAGGIKIEGWLFSESRELPIIIEVDESTISLQPRGQLFPRKKKALYTIPITSCLSKSRMVDDPTCIEFSSPIGDWCETKKLSTHRVNLIQVHTKDSSELIALISMLTNMRFMQLSERNTVVDGEGLTHPIAGKVSTFMIKECDHFGNRYRGPPRQYRVVINLSSPQTESGTKESPNVPSESNLQASSGNYTSVVSSPTQSNHIQHSTLGSSACITPQAARQELKAIRSLESSLGSPSIVYNEDGTYCVSYILVDSGYYQIHVFHQEKTVGSSPYAVFVHPGSVSPEHSLIIREANKIHLAGVPMSVTIHALDRHGNRISIGGDSFQMVMHLIDHPSEAENSICESNFAQNTSNRLQLEKAQPPNDSRRHPIFAQVEDNHDGSYTCKHTFEKAGTYEVSIFGDGGIHLQGSPYKVAVEAGPPCYANFRIFGHGLVKGVCGQPSEFYIIQSDIFGNLIKGSPESIEVRIHQADVNAEASSIKLERGLSANGSIFIKYFPSKSGLHNIHVSCDGFCLLKSPYQAYIESDEPSANHSKLTLRPGPHQAGEPISFTINMKDRFGNHCCPNQIDFRCLIRDLDSQEEAKEILLDFVKLEDHFKSDFTLTKSGSYKLDVFSNNPTKASGSWDLIGGVSLPVYILPSKIHVPNCWMEGSGLTLAVAGLESIFRIHARDQFGNRCEQAISGITIKLEGQGCRIPVTLMDNEDGSFTASYYAIHALEYELSVMSEGCHISGSPSKLVVGPAATSPMRCICPNIPRFRAGQSSVLKIIAKDRFGNHRRVGGDSFVIVLQRDLDIPSGSLRSRSTGTYDGPSIYRTSSNESGSSAVNQESTAEPPGKYKIYRLSSLDAVTDYPKQTNRIHETHSDLNLNYRKGKQFGHQRHSTSLTETKALLFPEPLSQTTSLPLDQYAKESDESTPIHYRLLDNNDGTYDLEIKFNKSGFYHMKISMDNEDIFGSPFMLQCIPGAPYPPNCFALGSGLVAGVAGEPVSFHIVLKDELGNPAWVTFERIRAIFTCISPKACYIDVASSEIRDDLHVVSAMCPGSGTYTVEALISGEPIRGSPFTTRVFPSKTSALHSIAEGSGLEFAISGSHSSFKIITKDEFHNDRLVGGDEIEVLLECKESAIKAKVQDMQDGTYVVSYTPSKSGQYIIKILINSMFMRAGDHHQVIVSPDAVHPGSCIIRGLCDQFVVGSSQTFEILTRDKYSNPQPASADSFRVAIRHVLSGSVYMPLAIYSEQECVTCVSFAVTLSGLYNIQVQFGEVYFPQSPWTVFASPGRVSAANCKIISPFGTVAIARKEIRIQIQACDEYGNEIATGGETEFMYKITGLNSCTASCSQDSNLMDAGDGSYFVDFVPEFAGEYTIDIYYRGYPIGTNPYSIIAQEPKTSAVKSHAYGLGISQAVVGVPSVFTIETRDQGGNPRGVGGDKISVIFDSEVTWNILDEDNGNYCVTYKSHSAGKQKMLVMVNGVSLQDCPYTVNVSPGAPSAEKTQFEVPGHFSVGKTARLSILVHDGHNIRRDIGNASLCLMVDGVQIDLDSKPPGTYYVDYRPNYEGQLSVCAMLDGVHVQGSPVQVLVHSDFQVRLKNLQNTIRTSHPHEEYMDKLRLSIKRETIVRDTIKSFKRLSASDWKRTTFVSFGEERGEDYNGLTREWLTELCVKLFDQSNKLFRSCPSLKPKLEPVTHPSLTEGEADMYRFCGRITGKALYDGLLRREKNGLIPLPIHFTKSIYRRILGLPVILDELFDSDEAMAQSLTWILETPSIDGIIEEFFEDFADASDSESKVELKPGGSSLIVTNSNRNEYVRLRLEYRVHGRFQKELDSFVSGFHDMIPLQLIQAFDENELDLLVSGMDQIDLDDLQANTVYEGLSDNIQVVKWFWEILRAFGFEQRRAFLKFVTGCENVPLGGFASLRPPFKIIRLDRDQGLPTASTCFNMLRLPLYTSKATFRERLIFAVTECQSFGAV